MLRRVPYPTERPNNVGVIGVEFYIPRGFVSLESLEKFDHVSKGKYTIGLEQERMAVVEDNEDIYSLCLNALNNLVERYEISYEDIGFLEVGTETLVDKSKSVKSVLMQLFAPSGNQEVEGADCKHACYGGTAAFFHALDWLESTSWDGRFAVVVVADIAVYAKGPARCTGGAGAVALLLGPDAPLVVEPGLRVSYSCHEWDFYKPNPCSEYPTVHGHLSISCYTRALRASYAAYKLKLYTRMQANARNGQLGNNISRSSSNARFNNSSANENSLNGSLAQQENGKIHGSSSDLDLGLAMKSFNDTNLNESSEHDLELESLKLSNFKALLFHSPFSKLVHKAFVQLHFFEALDLVDPDPSQCLVSSAVSNSFLAEKLRDFCFRYQSRVLSDCLPSANRLIDSMTPLPSCTSLSDASRTLVRDPERLAEASGLSLASLSSTNGALSLSSKFRSASSVLLSALAQKEPEASELTGNEMRELLALLEPEWRVHGEPCAYMGRLSGNMYAASLYAGLVSFLYNFSEPKSEKSTNGVHQSPQRILLFSYGSGTIASMFSMFIRGLCPSDERPGFAHPYTQSRPPASSSPTPVGECNGDQSKASHIQNGHLAPPSDSSSPSPDMNNHVTNEDKNDEHSAKASLDRLLRNVRANVNQLLAQRYEITPERFDALLSLRESNYGKAPFTPTAGTTSLAPGSYYLTQIDPDMKRHYRRHDVLLPKPVVQPDQTTLQLPSEHTVLVN